MRARRELITAARHVQIRQAVSICVEKSGGPVLIVLICLPRLPLGGLDEAAVLALDEQFAGNSWGSADEHIIQSVAGPIRHREWRAVARKLVGQQLLYGVVDLRRGWLRELQSSGIERLEPLLPPRPGTGQIGWAFLLLCIGLPDDQQAVSPETCQQLIAAVG